MTQEKNKLEKDLKNIMERSSFLQRKSSSGLDDLKTAKKEKIILEALSLRVNELEVENFLFKNKHEKEIFNKNINFNLFVL